LKTSNVAGEAKGKGRPDWFELVWRDDLSRTSHRIVWLSYRVAATVLAEKKESHAWYLRRDRYRAEPND
jgi:hypothetical protein